MCRKILFTVFTENFETEKLEQNFSCIIITKWGINEIERYLDFGNGFNMTLIEGRNLSFVVFTCFNIPFDDVIERIRTIPTSELVPELDSINYVKLECTEEINEEPLIRNKNEFLYRKNRFELGASGYSEFIIWASNHPVEMIFIAGLCWDTIKWVIKQGVIKIKKIFITSSISNGCKTSNSPLFISIKSLYKNFARMINVDQHDMQIIEISKIKRGKHNVIIRIITGEQFQVQCFANGKIISYKILPSKIFF